MGWMDGVNEKIAASVVGRWFRLEGSGHVSTKDPGIRAGALKPVPHSTSQP